MDITGCVVRRRLRSIWGPMHRKRVNSVENMLDLDDKVVFERQASKTQQDKRRLGSTADLTKSFYPLRRTYSYVEGYPMIY